MDAVVVEGRWWWWLVMAREAEGKVNTYHLVEGRTRRSTARRLLELDGTWS